jgi:adenylate cyclase
MSRLSIRQKLIGLVVVLLAAMLAVAGYSFFRTRALRDDLADLSEELIPLVNSLTYVNAKARDQQVALERALRYLRDPQHSDAQCRKAIESFATLNRTVREHIHEAKQQAQRSAGAAKKKEDVEKLAYVQAALVVLEKQHESYSESALELMKAELDARGDPRGTEQDRIFSFREDRLVEDVEELDHQLENQLSELVEFTKARAERLDRAEQAFYRSLRNNFTLAVVASLIGLILAVVITYRIVRPINDLVNASHRVQEGDLNTEVKVLSRDEVGELALAFNAMIEGLRAREQVKEAFGKYLDPRIVENLLVDVNVGEAEAERQVMTVFFSDIAGFSTISEQLTPSGLVRIINRYFTLATEPIATHHGVVDKYIGDAIMAFWGPPFTDKDSHAKLACEAALGQSEALAEFRRQLPELLGFRKGLPRVDVRIGLCTGDLVIGNIGSERAKSYTVMGDTVNVASRLEGANKQYGTRILISAATYEQVKDAFETREIDTVAVAGKKEPTRIFELLARKRQLEPAAARLRDEFERALAAYRSQDWDAAEAHLSECLEIDPEDGPTAVFRARIETLRAAPPPDDWDGVWRMQSK